jgi:hypothetical protein
MVRPENPTRPGILDSGTGASGDAFSRSVTADPSVLKLLPASGTARPPWLGEARSPRKERATSAAILADGPSSAGLPHQVTTPVQAHLRLTIHRSRTPLMGFPGGHEGT